MTLKTQIYQALETNKPVVETFRITKTLGRNYDTSPGEPTNYYFIQAECDFLIPEQYSKSVTIQHLHSGGIGGIDPSTNYKQILAESEIQLDDLKQMCDMLGIQYDDNTPIERNEE